MKNLLLLFLLLFWAEKTIGQNDSLVKRLDEAIRHKQDYVAVKEKRIGAYKKRLLSDLTREEEYATNEKLYAEYRKFRIDSAKYYIRRNLELAELLTSQDLKHKADIQLANLYSSSGDFLGSKAILERIRSKALPTGIKALYYEFYSQFYEQYATNSPSEDFGRQIEVYRDSLLGVLNPASNKYAINRAQHFINKKQWDKAEKLLADRLAISKQRDPDYVMYVYLLGDVHWAQNQKEKARDFYYLAAINDIENSIKDNAAVQRLALDDYDSGKIDRANQYAQSALEDAIFCNVKFRTLFMSEFYAIVNAAYQQKAEKNRLQLQLFLVLISVLTVFLIVAVVYVYRQMKKVSSVKEALSESAGKLESLNREILEANAELHESNRVKEEYIAQFFDICSSYINKLEDYRKKLNIKAVNKQFDELARALKSTDFTQSELQELYRNFDVIFINLFPTYVEEFNALLLPDEKIVLKDGEILNTELRIFALERLGINDSVRIASFLRFSLSTVYNYRTKMRNKAAVSKEAFETAIAKIGNRMGD